MKMAKTPQQAWKKPRVLNQFETHPEDTVVKVVTDDLEGADF